MAKNNQPSIKKDVRKVIRRAEESGWVVEYTRNGHIKWVAPDGVTILICPSTGSSRSWKNHLARLRRHGITEK